MLIYDALGNEQTHGWLAQKYGAIDIHIAPAGPAWRLYALCEDADGAAPEGSRPAWWPAPLATAAIVVKTFGPGSDAMPGIPVARYWPDAPALPPGRSHWQEQGVIGWTNVNGDAGFGMGPGDFYAPPAQQGATWIWVAELGIESDAVAGLGMLAGTNHSHMNAIFIWDPDDEPPLPPPDDELLDLLTDIRTALEILAEIAAAWYARTFPDPDTAATAGAGQ